MLIARGLPVWDWNLAIISEGSIFGDSATAEKGTMDSEIGGA